MNLIERQVWRGSRNLLVLNLSVLAGLGALAFCNRQYLYNCFAGPFAATAPDLLRIHDPAGTPRNFVSIDKVTPRETGLRIVEDGDKSKEETETARFFAVAVGDQYLLIRSTSPKPSSRYEGELVPIPDGVRSYFQKGLDEKSLAFEKVFLPYMLDDTTFRTSAYFSLAVCIPLALLSLWKTGRTVRWIVNPEASRIGRWLLRFGKPLDQVAAEIDADVNSGIVGTLKNTTLSSSWLQRQTFSGWDVVRLDEIVWVYYKVTAHSTNGVPTGKTYAAVVCDRHGRKLECPAKKEQARQFIEALVQKIPWVVNGFNDDLDEQFTRNRKPLVEAVEGRRRGFFATRLAVS